MTDPPVSRSVPSDGMLPSRLGWGMILAAVLVLILGPFALFGADLDRWSLTTLDALAARPLLSASLIVLLLAVDVVLPIPSSIVSTVAGAVLGAAGGAAASFVGMTVGCALGYAIGRSAGSGLARRLVGPRELSRLERTVSRHGDWTLVVARAVPVLAEASVVFAGMGSMRTGRFLAMTALPNLGISLVYATVGAYAVELQSFFLALAGAVAIPVVAVGAARLAGRGAQRA